MPNLSGVFASEDDELFQDLFATAPAFDSAPDSPASFDPIIEDDHADDPAQWPGVALSDGGKGHVLRVRAVDIDIRLPQLTAEQRRNFARVEVDDRMEISPDTGHGWREDSPIDRRYGRGTDAMARKRKSADGAYQNHHSKRRKSEEEASYDETKDGSDGGRRLRRSRLQNKKSSGKTMFGLPSESGPSTRTRASTRASSLMTSSDAEQEQANSDSAQTNGRRVGLRPQRPSLSYHNGSFAKDEEADELSQDNPYQDDDPKDNDFNFVVSDLQPQRGRRPKRGRGRHSLTNKVYQDSDIEFEKRRRSGRATKVTKSLLDPVIGDDDDIFYVEDDQPTARGKAVRPREIFQPPESADFRKLHRNTCDTCNSTSAKAPLVYCQGCSNAYHQGCFPPNPYTREHRVTKVGPGNYVMQCQFCVGRVSSRRQRAPEPPGQDTCLVCSAKGASCAPFSVKTTPKQAEKLREENGGEDPVTPVPAHLLNNPDIVLFRCFSCRGAYHYECLPHPFKNADPARDDEENKRKHRLNTYRAYWQCKRCMDIGDKKIDKIVAWRPADKTKKGARGLHLDDFREDQIEYLLKWEKMSYGHCTWMPGTWVYARAAATMRQAFCKRNFEQEDLAEADDGFQDSYLKYSEDEAIPDTYLMPEIILDAQCKPRTKDQEAEYKQLTPQKKVEDDLDRIGDVEKIYVKFEGLGYDEVVWEIPPDPSAGLMYSAFKDAYADFLGGKHFRSEPARTIKERIQAFRKLDFKSEIMYAKQPDGFSEHRLMEYQLAGVNWMLYNYRHERSVILADEMGLGKTVQVVAFLKSLVLDKPKAWPFLVVVPNATCPNWRREIKKWAPELRVVLYYGGATPQSLAYNYELFPNNSKEMRAHIVIMSYQSAVDTGTRNRFSTVKWAGLVVDEAHSLKNDQNNLPKALKQMNIPFSLLLTGTPLQNNKRELFNILAFIKPDLNAAELDEKYSDITADNISELHDLIRPFFLRRTKAEVLHKFLPPMTLVIVPLSMTVLQERLCKSILEKNPQLIRAIFAQTKLKASEKTGMNNILLQIRKCLCHPFIYSRAIEDRSAAPEVIFRNLIEASSKLQLLELMLPKLKERGHRVLIFTQFLAQLDILEDFLRGINLKYQRIDGSITSLDKQKRIDQFNNPDSDLFAMLLSTRAGGVGINLATADTVIILDPDWNPHIDIQALSRAHRLGQKKKVLCFQLMTRGSAEEKMLQIGRKKMALDEVLIESMDDKEGETASKDIESALRHGAAALFGEDQQREAIHYDEAAVDRLLERSIQEETKAKDSEDKTHESAFAYARVWANDASDLKQDVEATERTVKLSVWDDIIKQREDAARREAERNAQILGRGGRRRQAANYKMQDGGANESDGGSRDGDFVGGNATDSESDADAQNRDGSGERTTNGHRSRKGSNAQEERQASADTVRSNAPGRSKQQAPVPPANANGASDGKAGSERVRRRRSKVPNDHPLLPVRPVADPTARATNNVQASAGAGRGLAPAGAVPSPRTTLRLALAPKDMPATGSGGGLQTGMGRAIPGTRGPQGGTARGPAIGPEAGRKGQPAAGGSGGGGGARPIVSPRTAELGRLYALAQSNPAMTTKSAFQPRMEPTASVRSIAPAPPARQQQQQSPQHERQRDPHFLQVMQRQRDRQILQLMQQHQHRQRPTTLIDDIDWTHGCFICGFMHPRKWQCPEMFSEARLRLALDDIRNEAVVEQRDAKRLFLLMRLHMLRMQAQAQAEARTQAPSG